MKLKRWLSRGIVLAMVVALMVPMPVAAKSGKSGGKLVKSVTYYSPQQSGGWRAESKVTYKYGKKKMPTAITTTDYDSYFLGAPVGGSSQTVTFKYKGKTAKSYDSAGFLTGKRTYKGGKVASYSWDDKTSHKEKQADGSYVDKATFTAGVGHASYFKNGLAKASDYTYAYQDSDNKAYSHVTNTVYAWTQKKGIPSAVVTTTVTNGTDYDGEAFDGKPSSDYAIFNSKGLAIEIGSVVEGKNVPDYAIQYTMKKGKVASAVVYAIDEKGTPEPVSMMKFKYTKTKVSKKANFNMINSLIEGDEYFYVPGDFSWF